MIPAQSDIWWYESEEAKSRPVLVVTRNEVIPGLGRIMVAPITRTVRGLLTEVPLDVEDGLAFPCVAAFDNLQVVLKSHLTERVGTIAHRRYEICAALNAVADC
ncbi:type II toxin-antitoxin system PemK/MazF family toxin [Candidatus Poriferisocius sp.]|uniref:type II toxin-antitoxin system PemK/MazF family toxin n=1 Tax=Candidatus Poriferisocius sp. TaxID=3101276 RepID=UPI003B02AE4C